MSKRVARSGGYTWRARYRLRTLLMVCGLLAGVLALPANRYHWIKRQREAADACGWIMVQTDGNTVERWLEAVIGDGTFTPYVYCATPRWTSDADLKHLREFPDLKELNLNGGQTSDEGLSELRQLHYLSALELFGTAVSGKGLKMLSELPQLRYLWVEGGTINESGLRNLQRKCPALTIEYGCHLKPVLPAKTGH